MAAVTKSLGFGVTASTSYEAPFLLARRFASLDHFTKGRIGWNIVTSWNKASALAMGLKDIIAHDERYNVAEEYMQLCYNKTSQLKGSRGVFLMKFNLMLWESSFAGDALVEDTETETYFDPDKVRVIKHHGKYFDTDGPFLVDPSPQRTPFLFQAGTSP